MSDKSERFCDMQGITVKGCEQGATKGKSLGMTLYQYTISLHCSNQQCANRDRTIVVTQPNEQSAQNDAIFSMHIDCSVHAGDLGDNPILDDLES